MKEEKVKIDKTWKITGSINVDILRKLSKEKIKDPEVAYSFKLYINDNKFKMLYMNEFDEKIQYLSFKPLGEWNIVFKELKLYPI